MRKEMIHKIVGKIMGFIFGVALTSFILVFGTASIQCIRTWMAGQTPDVAYICALGCVLTASGYICSKF